MMQLVMNQLEQTLKMNTNQGDDGNINKDDVKEQATADCLETITEEEKYIKISVMLAITLDVQIAKEVQLGSIVFWCYSRVD